MKARLALAALAAATAAASGAFACDIGRFPENPAGRTPAVIALGRVEKQTLTQDPPGPSAGGSRRPDPPKYTAHADIVIDRVPLGVLTEKSWRLDYPATTPDDWCVFADDGPQLKEGQRVALYFRLVDGKPAAPVWFHEDTALSMDPRAAKAPRP